MRPAPEGDGALRMVSSPARAEGFRLGVVTGLRAEARLFGPHARAGGGTGVGAARVAESLVRDGATALLSFGLAGGLDPALAAGALIVPRQVISGSTRWGCDAGLLALVGGATVEQLFAGDSVVASVVSKLALFRETACAAIDLESGAVAAVAERAGLPFAVLRAVCDPAARALPPAALAALDGAGVIGFGRVLASVLRNPSQIPALLALARDAASARAALGRIVQEKTLHAA